VTGSVGPKEAALRKARESKAGGKKAEEGPEDLPQRWDDLRDGSKRPCSHPGHEGQRGGASDSLTSSQNAPSSYAR
jgi:hypothetical protein